MSTEIVANPQLIEQRGADLHLVAETPQEMGQCQGALIAWVKWKIDTCQAEVVELKDAEDHARKQKWKTGVLHRHWLLAVKRLEYYQKMLGALEAGYYIVPNFPVEIFAIRNVKDRTLKGGMTESYWATFEQKSQALPAGEGEYKNPFPMIRTDESSKPEGQKAKYWPSEWDTLEFPINMAKPQIMKMVDRAMALKVFDEIGILPKSKKEDPLIVGIIRLISGPYRAGKTVTFILAWHLNTRDL